MTTLRTPASSITFGLPVAILDAILPSLSISKAEGVDLVPISIPT